MNTQANIKSHQSKIANQPRQVAEVLAKPEPSLWMKLGGDKATCYFINEVNELGQPLLPIGPWRSEQDATNIINRLRDICPTSSYEKSPQLLEVGMFDHLECKRRVALGDVRVRLNTSYAEKHGLFRVVNGWTAAHYVTFSDFPLESVLHDIEKTTPIGKVGPFEDEAEASRAMISLSRAYPEEAFKIVRIHFASGICLPKHLPAEQETARAKVASIAHKWQRIGGFVKYYTLDNGTQRLAPFGKIGPFPTPSEARAAMDRIEAKFPGATVVCSECGFVDDFITDAELDEQHAKALVKLAALGD